jgi:tRNA-guanine family transglycosylase
MPVQAKRIQCLTYTKQGHIPHLLQPEVVGQRLVALEQFMATPIPMEGTVLHPTDLNRLYSRHIKSTQKGLGLQDNGNNYVCTPTMLHEASEKLKPERIILSDPQQEIFEFKYNTKTLNQEAKHHSRFFKFVEQVEGPLTVCVCGTSAESIRKSSHDFKRLERKIHGYGIVLPTPLSHESRDPTFRKDYLDLLDAFVQSTGNEKPKTVLGVSSFSYFLECFKRGISVVDNSWVERAVSKGLAYTLVKTATGYKEVVQDFSKNQTQWKHDFESIEVQCGCWTCARHSRSYIHHLFCVNDMLSYVMLMYHNSYQMELFMNLVREAIDTDSLEELYIDALDL